EEGEGEIGEEPREAPGEEIEEIARQEPQAGGDPRRGLLDPVPLPEVARAFEREFGVERAALGSPESAPLPGAPPLHQGEEPRREEDPGDEGRQTAPAAPRREIDQDGQSEQTQERARGHGRAEQDSGAGEERQVLPFQTSPGEQRKEDARHE